MQYRKNDDCFNIKTYPTGTTYLMPKCQNCVQENRKFRNKETQKRYRINSKEKSSARLKKYYNKNKTNLLFKEKLRREKNPDKESARHKLYKENNKNKIKLRRAEKAKIRRKNDPSFKLRQNISRAIRHALNKNQSNKNRLSCTKYLNYTANDLKLHLESLFEPWMSWENYGIYKPSDWNDADPTTWVWQIDHIMAQAELPYKSMEDENFKKCWDLKNLRPLSGKENFSKGQETLKMKVKRAL